jgi:DNA invertase Pin-like site-specific DNA recombinase
MFETACPILAAQYLRMSTEHQQYSIENQIVAIQRYATVHGSFIVQSYTDAGKSGLVLNQREGLRQLLEDVLSGDVAFKAILVFEVSQWGRFQDVDEAAHYEFLCRSGGIPVHYCAESFPNDGSLSSMIMKALKRMMASEYSRELTAKVYAGASRLAQLGFKQGGIPGYGYRRTLVSPSREPKQILLPGQRKSIHEDRVVLVPGPHKVVDCVREIFRMFVDEQKIPKAIAEELNARDLKYHGALREQMVRCQGAWVAHTRLAKHNAGHRHQHATQIHIRHRVWATLKTALRYYGRMSIFKPANATDIAAALVTAATWQSFQYKIQKQGALPENPALVISDFLAS